MEEVLSSSLVTAVSGHKNRVKNIKIIREEQKLFISASLTKNRRTILIRTRTRRSHRELAAPAAGAVGRCTPCPPCPPAITGTAQSPALSVGSKAGTAQDALAVNFDCPSFGLMSALIRMRPSRSSGLILM